MDYNTIFPGYWFDYIIVSIKDAFDCFCSLYK